MIEKKTCLACIMRSMWGQLFGYEHVCMLKVCVPCGPMSIEIFFFSISGSFCWISIWLLGRESQTRSSFSGKNTRSTLYFASYHVLVISFCLSVSSFNDFVYGLWFLRDGVSESQFNQVLNIELDQIIEVCMQLSIFLLYWAQNIN